MKFRQGPRATPELEEGRVLIPWSRQDGHRSPVIVRAEGSFLYDEYGNALLDLSSGQVAMNLGHGHPAVVKALQQQAAELCWVPSSFRSDKRDTYAQMLNEISPWAEGLRVHFTSGGAEANDDAVKTARMITGRSKILTAYRSYHGSTLGGNALSGVDRWRDPLPSLPGIVKFFAPYPYRSPFGDVSAEEEAVQALHHLERILTHEGAHNVAALLIEPVTGSSGFVQYPPGYLDGVRDLCTRHGIVLIFDEVMTGFGRVGAPFAANRLGVEPDIITFAKGASSAYVPLGGVLVRESLARYFDAEIFDVGHTYSGHVLAVAAGVAALEVYKEENLFERARELEPHLRDGLEGLQERHPVVGDVRGLGAHFALELVRDRDTRHPLVEWHDPSSSTPMDVFFAALRRRGVHTYGRYNIVAVTPPLTISDRELQHAFNALDGALTELEAAIDNETVPQ